MAHLSNWDIIGRLLLAAVVGGAIGFERETAGQDAGLRTHLMLALGAAIFGEISVGAWDHFQTPTANSIFRADVTRVASYVAAGIGFVGGGAIVKSAGQVRGLTTAASLWVAGAAGLGAGVGFWLPAMRRLIQYVGTRRIGAATIVLDDDADPGRVVDALRALPNPPTKIRLGAGEDDDNVEIEAEFGLRHADEVAEFLQTIGARPDVKAVNVR
jgi:putative Mg2+ transporter-C (MgtC) family protein